MSANTASQFIDFVNSKFETKGYPSEFNFSYIASGMPNSYTIVKRSAKDPLRSYPIASVHFAASLDYAPHSQMIEEFCELYSKKEYEFFKEQREQDGKISINKPEEKEE